MRRVDGGLVLDLRGGGGESGMGGLIGTADEVLEHIQVALGVTR